MRTSYVPITPGIILIQIMYHGLSDGRPQVNAVTREQADKFIHSHTDTQLAY